LLIPDAIFILPFITTPFRQKNIPWDYKIVNQVDRVTAFYLGWKNTIPEKKKFALGGRNPKGCFSDGTAW